MTDVIVQANQEELKRGAQFGWVMTLELPYPNYKDIVGDFGNSQQAIDEFFTNYYMEDFEGRLKKHLINLKSVLPESLQNLLFEAVWAFENRKNQICVPALFSVLEGMLVELSNKGDRNPTRYKGGIDNAVKYDNLTVIAIPLVSIAWFLDFAFCHSKFEQNDFIQLNRHWSQHGRYLELLDEKPVLQLLSAIALVLFIYEIKTWT
jgi:hypothetical protein